MIYNLGPPKCSTEVRLTYVERERERGEGDNIQYTYDCRTRSKQSGDANFEHSYLHQTKVVYETAPSDGTSFKAPAPSSGM